MLNFGTFFLWSLAACLLWRGSLAEDLTSHFVCLLDDPDPNHCDSFCLNELRPLLKQVLKGQGRGITCDADNETKAKLDRLVGQEARLASQFQGVEVKMEGQLQEVQARLEAKLEGQLHGVETKLEGRLQEVKVKMEGVEAKLEGRLQEVQTKLEGQLQQVQTKLEAKLEGQQAVLTRMAESLAKLAGNLPAVQTKPQATLKKSKNQNPLQAVSTTTEANVNIPSEFEKIGTRYFKIAKERAHWDTAERRCREMGGYLAAFRNEQEFNAIIKRLPENRPYWLGLNDRDSEGHFVSVASNKPAQFFKWFMRQPDNYDNKENCVALFYEKMWDYRCDNIYFFICQADNET